LEVWKIDAYLLYLNYDEPFILLYIVKTAESFKEQNEWEMLETVQENLILMETFQKSGIQKGRKEEWIEMLECENESNCKENIWHYSLCCIINTHT